MMFIGTCVQLKAGDLDKFDDSSRDITYRTFRKHVGGETVKEINEWAGVPTHKDWHIRFKRGKWRGKPAACLMHSSIHHIWQL